MVVLDPNNTVHDFYVITRADISDSAQVEVYNKATDTEFTAVSTLIQQDADRYRIRITLTVVEGQTYSYKIVESGSVYFRGVMFVTAQTPQDYVIDNGKYTYSPI